MIQGIIDIGSNTIRMAIYQVLDDTIKLLIKKKHSVGLAAYIHDGCMQREGIDETCVVLHEYKLFLETFNIENVVAFATAALRNVDNSHEAVAEIMQRTGIYINVISGAEEADLAFNGATNTLPFDDGILVDIGGASTELVLFKHKNIQEIISLPVGSLAMHKQYVAGLFPTQQEAEQIRGFVCECLAREAGFVRASNLPICGIGGTFKGTYLLNNTLYALPQENCMINAAHLPEMTAKFICNENTMALDLLDILVKVTPERIKTIVPGMIVADAMANFFGSEMIVYSDSGVREGYLYKEIIGKRA